MAVLGQPSGKAARIKTQDCRGNYSRHRGRMGGSGAGVLERMARDEPAKFAQLAAGLIPREAMLTVVQRLPGNLEGEDWELMLSVCAAIKQALPDANQQSPSAVLEFVLNAIRQADATLIEGESK